MTEENSQSLQYALNKSKMTELNVKNQLDLLQTSVEQRKSFRTLSLLINKIKESVEELKTNLDSIMMVKVTSSSIDSVMKRQSNLISRLEKLELEVNSLDDDGQLSQSSNRVSDDISWVSQSSRRQLESQRSTPVSQKSVKDDLTMKNSVSDVSPQVPPRPAKPSFFLPQGQSKLNLLSNFLQNNQQFFQVSREWTEEPVEDSTTTNHINQSMSLLAAPTKAPTQIFRTKVQDRFVLGNHQSPATWVYKNTRTPSTSLLQSNNPPFHWIELQSYFLLNLLTTSLN